MPANVKQESADIDGNQFIISGTDHNRHDGELRAIEKIVGFSGACSVAGAIHDIAQRLQDLQNNFVLTTSGVIAAIDPTYNPSGTALTMNFPSSWSVTTLQDDLADDTTTDEATFDPIDGVVLNDITGMPLEGYITIINDVSLGQSLVSHPTPFKTTTSNSVASTLYAKNGSLFAYFFQVSVPLNFSSGQLPTGLVFDSINQTITGTPTVSGAFSSVFIGIENRSGSTMTLNLTINVADTSTPTLGTLSPQTIPAGSTFTFTIPVTASLNNYVFTASPLPSGLTLFNGKITGTPSTAGVTGVVITVTDSYGGTTSGTLSITVTGNVAGNPAPTITSISPTSSASIGGATVTITGTGFIAGAKAYFGTVPTYTLATTTFVSATTLTAIVPVLAFNSSSAIDVAVQNTDDQAFAFASSFTAASFADSVIQSLRYTSLYDSQTDPIYPIESTGGQTNRSSRIFGMGTNVEILFYSGLDPSNNAILNVQRKQMGTTSTRHGPGDLVFKGIASIHVSPVLYQTDGNNLSDIDCFLRSNGRIEMHTRQVVRNDLGTSTQGFSGTFSYSDDILRGYASYQATLIKNLDPLTIPTFDGC